MKLFAAILALGLWSVSHAETRTMRVGSCHTKTADFSLYLEAGKKLTDGALLQVMSSQVSPLSGLNLSTAGRLRAKTKKIELPHWKPGALSFDDCKLDEIVPPARPVSFQPPRKPVDHLMYVQVFFILGEPRPDIDVDDLYKRGQAMPLKVKIICSTTEDEPSVLSCDRVTVLDEIIPLGSVDVRAIGERFSAAVQLESGPCAEPAKRIRSSGVVVQYGGRKLVVTSSGAVDGCTDVVAGTARTRLMLQRIDHAAGLAAFDGTALAIDAAALTKEPLAETAIVHGFSKSGVEAVAKTFRVLSESSVRHFLPAIARTFELQGQIVDAGFVGAPAVAVDGRVSGIVSHQYLRIHPGSLTRPTRWRPLEKESADHVVTIPSAEIAAWLDSSARLGEIEIARDARFGAALVLKSGHLAFEEDCPSLDATKPNSDYPIGGGDPVGIGGDASNYRACRIKVTLSEGGSAKFFSPAFQAWHDETAALLKSSDADFVELSFSLQRDEKGRLSRRYFYSVESFFQGLVQRSADKVVSVVRRKSTKTPGLDPRLESLRMSALDAASRARGVYANFETTDTKISGLVRRIYFLGTLAQSEQWAALNESDFNEYMDMNGPYRKAWQTIMSLALGGKGLRMATEKLQAEWQKAPK